MKPLEHTSALGWIIALSTVGWLIAGLIVIVSIGSRSNGLPIALGAAGFFLAILVPSVVGAIVLHGVKQMLKQVREPVMLPSRAQSLQERAEGSGSGSEGSAAEGSVWDAGVDLRGGDRGVPEQPLDR